MIKKIKQPEFRALLELMTGVLLFGLVCQLAGLIFPLNQGRYAAGLWIGILTALLNACLMLHSLNRAFQSSERQAAVAMAGGYVVRYLLVAAVLLAVYFLDAGYVLAVFLGVMGLKIGAYLQPLMHKCYNRLFHETDPVPQPLPEEPGKDEDE